VLALLPTGRSDPLVEPAELPTPRSRTATALAELRDRRIRGNAVLTIEEPLT